jgi:hypothetical protein
MPRVLLVEGGATHDVFEVVEVVDGLVRARAPYLFEVGEELRLQIDDQERSARVRAHVAGVTELELL